MDFYHKYIKYKKKYINYKMIGGSNKFSFVNSSGKKIEFTNTNKITDGHINNVDINYGRINIKYKYFIININNKILGFIFIEFKKCWKNLTIPQNLQINSQQQLKPPQFTEYNKFIINNETYIFYWHWIWNSKKGITVLNKNNTKGNIYNIFTNADGEESKIEITLNGTCKVKYTIFFIQNSGQKYGFIKNVSSSSSSTKWNHLQYQKILDIKCKSTESNNNNYNFSCSEEKKFEKLKISDIFEYKKIGNKSIILKNDNWLYTVFDNIKKNSISKKFFNQRSLHIELSSEPSYVKKRLDYIKTNNISINIDYLLDKNNWNLGGKNNSAIMLDLSNLPKFNQWNNPKPHMTIYHKQEGFSKQEFNIIIKNVIKIIEIIESNK